MPQIADLRLDETTWAAATALRRAEWNASRLDLIAHGDFASELAGTYLLATPGSTAVLFEALDEEGYVRAAIDIEHVWLADSVQEYVSIIQSMDKSAHHRDAAWFEAVDMAKKVVHDKAAQILARHVTALTSDHATLRRVFTLVFALTVDTTTLHHARGHGPRSFREKG